MSRTSTLILLGILVILAPFSGLPLTAWRLLEVIFGIGVFVIGLSIRTHEAHSAQPLVQTREPEPASPPQGVSPI